MNGMQFIYGIHPVLAALTFKQRTISRLFLREDYLCNTLHEHSVSRSWISRIQTLSREIGIPILTASLEDLRRLVNGRSHQGVVLEAGPLPIEEITRRSVSNWLREHTNKANDNFLTQQSCRPLILLLDHLTDVMNVGSILRSAVFFGACTVIFSSSPCVVPSALISKLSAGALECIRYFRLSSTVQDLNVLRDSGFLFVGTVGNGTSEGDDGRYRASCLLRPYEVGFGDDGGTGITPRPLILVLGSESKVWSIHTMNPLNTDFEYANAEELLPPSAFVNCPSETRIHWTALARVGLGSDTKASDVQNVHFCTDHADHCAATDELASLASKLALSEARNRELETSLRVSRKDRLCVQHSKDEAYTQLQQLRAYIGSSAINESPSLVPPKRDPPEPISPDEVTLTRGFTDKVSSLQEENEQLKRELDLSLVRVRSLEAVLHLQEKQLCSSDTKEKSLATSETVAKREQLLACWRKQVLRMLIEVENYKAEVADNAGKLTRQYQLLDDTRRSARAEHEALQLKLQANQAAFLAEKQRVDLLSKQLQREKSKHEALQKSYSEVRKMAVASLSNLHAHAAKLSHTALQFLQPPVDPERLPANSLSAPHIFYRLRQLERRLNFAVNRLPLLGAHMAVRRSVSPGRCDQAIQTCSPIRNNFGSLSLAEMEELISHAQAEAEQLKQERDSVLRKLEQNARTSNERVQTAREEVKLEVSNLRELTRVLEESLKKKNEELNSCHMQLDELKTCQLRIQQEATEERSRLQAQLAEMNKQLAKAKIEVRRAERRIDRDLNERKLLIAEMEDNCRAHIQHPEHTSHTVQPNLCAVSATDVKVNLQPVLNGSTDTNTSHCLNPAQLDAVAKSLHQLTQLAKCLKSDSSDDADSSEIQT
ncbi:hypothetical protein P879_06246 [Paragonimus westermani]|uniref:rRNA methyltransferase 1, mitochondrial n=1 Tax=Paragonimus westermani TaxID=34504 RepID=A0A8T0DNB2_9TREM|nr:hypothetical protein P879_06246 [Paragonimus westermani]